MFPAISLLSYITYCHLRNGRLPIAYDRPSEIWVLLFQVGAQRKFRLCEYKRIKKDPQQITYNVFDKTESIEQANKRIEFVYGPDLSRKIMKTYEKEGGNFVLKKSKYYILGNTEIEVNHQTDETRTLSYIANKAIWEQNAATSNQLYYLHQDYQGSLLAVTYQNGNVAQHYAYDPWGRRRNPTTWANLSATEITQQNFLFARGYTGHEHLDEFGLINMNGRMYDPLLGRMLSPDNFVQAPDNSQNFNRYSYAMNNPLVYTDPDGEAIILSGIYGMLTSGFFYLVNNESNFNLGNFTGALVSGFVAGATGNIMSNFGIGGIKAGAITGGLTGLSNNLTSSIINSDDETFNNSISGLGIGSLLGGAMGGLDAYIKGSNIWNGKGKHVIKRYAIDGGDQTVKKTRYWNDGRIAKSNEVESEDLERAPHVREITWPKNYARQHYDDDLTIEVDAYPPTGQHFFVNVDDQQVLKLERPGKISITISKNLSKITWGLEGVPHRFADFFFPDVNVAGYTTVRPSSQINIYGNWRKWNGFLFWP